MPAAARSASITLVCGMSGSGKTHWLLSKIKKQNRVLVWDMKNEYARDHGFESIDNKGALIERLRTSRTGRIAFHSINPKDFDFFCRAAYAWGRCVVISEELADVTSPGKAPLGWGMVLRRGRDRRLIVYGVTQRPVESDKTIMGNVTLIHCHALPLQSDRDYMAKQLDVPPQRLNDLEPYEWIEREGRIIRTNKPANTAARTR